MTSAGGDDRSGLKLRRRWSVSHELPETEQTVIFDPARSELLVLNDAGGALWHLLDGQRDLGAVADFIRAERADAPPRDALLAQFEPLISELLSRGAIEIVS
ncbi:MAG TPA: PqqD family protein [Polyangiaceae bacterium]|nr:PqqD family protein [Polyangiaceae bacterium]